ncbi:MAG: hypothetical protein BRC30_02775 [Nanohaloarchaea archaeon SW_7_46_7]|nr:MAG: hypothetical protein BRC30_02775 [Nanohaloarchaea archaeon SW_7_46_7]
MDRRPLITALLETGNSFLHLEQQEISPETAQELETGRRISYSEYVEQALQTGEKLPNYHSITEKLAENSSILYENNLLRPEASKQVSESLKILDGNVDRSLNHGEIEAVVTTAMNSEAFPRKAIDKEKLVEKLYIDIYAGSDTVYDELLP